MKLYMLYPYNSSSNVNSIYDGKYHEITVNGIFELNVDDNILYFVEYFDNNVHKELYTFWGKKNDKFFKIPLDSYDETNIVSFIEKHTVKVYEQDGLSLLGINEGDKIYLTDYASLDTIVDVSNRGHKYETEFESVSKDKEEKKELQDYYIIYDDDDNIVSIYTFYSYKNDNNNIYSYRYISDFKGESLLNKVDSNVIRKLKKDEVYRYLESNGRIVLINNNLVKQNRRNMLFQDLDIIVEDSFYDKDKYDEVFLDYLGGKYKSQNEDSEDIILDKYSNDVNEYVKKIDSKFKEYGNHSTYYIISDLIRMGVDKVDIASIISKYKESIEENKRFK